MWDTLFCYCNQFLCEMVRVSDDILYKILCREDLNSSSVALFTFSR